MAVRKIHTKSGRKVREAIRLGPVPLEGDSEKEEHYMCRVGRDLSWGMSSLSQILDTPALGFDTGKTSLLVWLEGQWE